MSGLHINMAKSKLVLIGKLLNMVELVGLLGCRQSSLPMTYMGLPLGLNLRIGQFGTLFLKTLSED